ncbi:hypothetical protein DCS_08264 [Drechmeria coniospora]|uniref:Major facilitator superfamily (MFS) profile domain-containing protein n=1 Tax=Drechmeria coniospora TaxID=98403 RepID=A0A151GGT5_DRECN|nr:hypothetical protein DCS_08264 [Drechmeria coniospora]KYK56294.1 hypothetical protein DCS_08264 [Drechmeria coniospora]
MTEYDEKVHTVYEERQSSVHTAQNIDKIEAPISWKAYLICAFASLGGILSGYDSGYLSSVLGQQPFIDAVMGPGQPFLSRISISLLCYIPVCGTFFGAIIGGDVADWIGRKWTIIIACFVYLFGVILQMTTSPGNAMCTMVTGLIFSSFGMAIVSAIVILYLSEICPRKVRGTIVAGYQFCITIGDLLASVVSYASQDYTTTAAYRVPIAILLPCALIIGIGLLFMPESPRYFIKKGMVQKATSALSRVRCQPESSKYIQREIAEIITNEEYESALIPSTTWFGSWADCFKGSIWKSSSNLRRTILGTSLQVMRQLTGASFISAYSSFFFMSTGAISNGFIISLIFTLINICSTPLSFWTVERFGRRTILIWGGLGMVICQFLIAIIGVTVGFDFTIPDPADPYNSLAINVPAVNAQIAFFAIFTFLFASTWGPCTWVVTGEIFPQHIRSRGVALSTASNELLDGVMAVIIPRLVPFGPGSLKSSIFFVSGSSCICALAYAYFLIPETKGLSLEQVCKMMEECSPRRSVKWRPQKTFARSISSSEIFDKSLPPTPSYAPY